MPKMTAERQAREHIELNKFDHETYRVVDTDNKNAPAWVITMSATGAVVVYEDDPHSVCSCANEGERWQRA